MTATGEDVVLTVSSETLYTIVSFAFGVCSGVGLVRLWAGMAGRW